MEHAYICRVVISQKSRCLKVSPPPGPDDVGLLSRERKSEATCRIRNSQSRVSGQENRIPENVCILIHMCNICTFIHVYIHIIHTYMYKQIYSQSCTYKCKCIRVRIESKTFGTELPQ